MIFSKYSYFWVFCSATTEDGRDIRFSCSATAQGNNGIFDKEGVKDFFITNSKERGYDITNGSIIIENWERFKNKKEFETFKGKYIMKYGKMEKSEYHDFHLESKHVKYDTQVANILREALRYSKYTKEELAERLDWDLHRLMMVLSGNKTIDIYDMVHVAGALGYKWKFNLVMEDNNEYI